MAAHLVRERTSCPVCDSSDYDILYRPWVHIDDPARLYSAASGIPGTQTLVKCRNCGVIYENPRYPGKVIIQSYMASEEAGHDSQYEMRVRSFDAALRRLAARLPGKGARVLDVGTAGGAFLEAAERFGYEAHGLEPSRYLVEQGKRRGLRIEQGTIESHGFSPGRFDMVTLWDVIEHLPDPKMALLEIAKLLKPDAVLLINYPDIGTWQARLAGRRFWWILSVHLHHFTRESIADICQRTGYTAFHFQRHWQILELGHLEQMTVRYKIPFSRLIMRLTPGFIQRIPVRYYASQTTALASLC